MFYTISNPIGSSLIIMKHGYQNAGQDGQELHVFLVAVPLMVVPDKKVMGICIKPIIPFDKGKLVLGSP